MLKPNCHRTLHIPMAGIALLVFFWVSVANAVVDMRLLNYSDTWTDYKTEEYGYPLFVERSYNSRSLYRGLFGFGWCSNFEDRLDLTPEGNLILVQCGDGSRETFFRQGPAPDTTSVTDKILNRLRNLPATENPFLKDEAFLPRLKNVLNEADSGAKLRASLTKQFDLIEPIPDGTLFVSSETSRRIQVQDRKFILEEDNRLRHFNSKGRLIFHQWKGKQAQSYEYEGVRLVRIADAEGKSLRFEYDGTTLVKRILTPDAKTLSYKHSPEDTLIEAVSGWGNQYRYEYDSELNLTRVVYPDQSDKRIYYDRGKDWVLGFKNRDNCFENYTFDLSNFDEMRYRILAKKSCSETIVTNASFEFWYETGSLDRRYISRSRIDTETAEGIWFRDFTKDEFGKWLSLKTPQIQAKLHYLPDGRLSAIEADSHRLSYSYKGKSNLPDQLTETRTQVSSEDPVIVQYVYNEQAKPILIAFKSGTEWQLVNKTSPQNEVVIHADKNRMEISGYPADITLRVTVPGLGSIDCLFGEGISCTGEDARNAEQIYSLYSKVSPYLLPAYGQLFNYWRPVSIRTKGEPQKWLETGSPSDSDDFRLRLIDARIRGDYKSFLTTITDWKRYLAAQKENFSETNVEISGILRNVAQERQSLKDYQTANQIAESALRHDEMNRASTLSETLLLLASIRFDMERYQESKLQVERAINEIEKIKGVQSTDLIGPLLLLGKIQEALFQYTEAIDSNRRAYSLAQSSVSTFGRADLQALRNIADIYQELGRFREAVGYYEQAYFLNYLAWGPEAEGTLNLLANLGWVEFQTGRNRASQTRLQKALETIEQKYGVNHRLTAWVFNHLGVNYSQMDRYALSLECFERSSSIYKLLYGEATATVLSNLGLLYHDLGNLTRAEEFYIQSMKVRDDEVGKSITLRHLANVQWKLGNKEAAWKSLEQSLAIQKRIYGTSHWRYARGLLVRAWMEKDQGNYAAAQKLMQQSLRISQSVFGELHPYVAEAYLSNAELLIALRRPNEALSSAINGLKIRAQIEQTSTWYGDYVIAKILHRKGNVQAATLFGKKAVNSIQGVRTLNVTLDRELQDSFVTDKFDLYRFLADLFIEQGRLPEAQQVLSMLKEREFHDFVRADSTESIRINVAYSPAESEIMKRYEQINQNLAQLGQEYTALKEKSEGGLTPEEITRRQNLESDLKVARVAFDTIVANLHKEIQRGDDPARIMEIGQKNLNSLKAIRNTLAELGEGTILLHYIIVPDKVHILLTTPSIQISRYSSIDQKELNRKVQRFRTKLQNPLSNPLPPAQELYSILIQPVAVDLKDSKAKTVMISLDGVLRYIPISALHDGKQYMAEKYNVVLFTETARDKLKDSNQISWKLAAFGLTKTVEGFDELGSVKEELDSIVLEGEDQNGVLPGQVFLDEEYSLQSLKQALDQNYPVVHIASHFVFQPGAEMNSFLLLGDGSKLTIDQLQDDELDFKNVDLMTLSACGTAVGGGKDANGQEIESFGALAQRQGTKSVLATLWPIADNSTAVFMKYFYTIRENQRLTKAEALRAVQNLFLKGGSLKASAPREESSSVLLQDRRESSSPSYSHPYYWAPFILMGNFK